MFHTKKTETEGRRKLFPFLNEKGNMLVWYVFMFPVFLGAVGLAVDVANVAAVRTSLQVSLDAATQGTVALSKNQATGKPRFTSTALAQAEAIQLYDANRSGMSKAGLYKEGIPFLLCQTSKSGSGTLINPSSSHCGFTLTSFKYSGTGGLKNGGYITMTVQEKADTIFMQFLGFDDLTYTITSTARLTNSLDVK
jgi:Flp pilus assembly protein TadG